VARILFLGRLQDLARTRELAADLPPGVSDTQGVRDWLGRSHPELLDQSVRIAVNSQLRPGNVPVADGDEIAFLPPMSGG
jgi:molybdopterin converting factor subunit 1